MLLGYIYYKKYQQLFMRRKTPANSLVYSVRDAEESNHSKSSHTPGQLGALYQSQSFPSQHYK